MRAAKAAGIFRKSTSTPTPHYPSSCIVVIRFSKNASNTKKSARAYCEVMLTDRYTNRGNMYQTV